MNELALNLAFEVYAVFAAVLSLMLLGIDGSSGLYRAKTRTAVNAEDAATVAKGSKVVDGDPDSVARVMRAHRNALANVVPFLIVTLVWVLMGATAQRVLLICSVFTVARLAHAVVYIRAMQPWRTVSFVVGLLCTLAVAVRVIIAAVHVFSAAGFQLTWPT